MSGLSNLIICKSSVRLGTSSGRAPTISNYSQFAIAYPLTSNRIVRERYYLMSERGKRLLGQQLQATASSLNINSARGGVKDSKKTASREHSDTEQH